MSGSILQDRQECYITRSPYGLHKHHIYFGAGRRELSEKYGCWVWLRWDWHNGAAYGVHGKDGRLLDQRLKAECQRAFERGRTRDEFRKIFGRSYL